MAIVAEGPRVPPHPFSLRQLQYAVAVADLGGFRKAADACHVAQPSLSAQVAALEAAIGVRLFDRRGPRVSMTPQGREVISAMRAALAAADGVSEAAQRLSDPFESSLRVGVIPTLAPYVLPRIAPAVAGRHPKLEIVWSEAQTDALSADLNAGRLDAALLALESKLVGLDHAALVKDDFVLAMAEARGKGGKTIALDSLGGERVLLLEDGHCLRDQALPICERLGVREGAFRATSLATLTQMVAAGLGVTLLPELSLDVETRRAGLVIRRFPDPAPGRTVALAWRTGSSLAAPLREIAATMKAALSGERAPRSRSTTGAR